MTPITEHPLRCETCNFREDYMPFGSKCPMRHFDWSPQQIERITTNIGCASHSDYKSLDKIRDDLGEKLQAYFDPKYPLYLPPTSPGGQAIRTVFEYLLRRGEFK